MITKAPNDKALFNFTGHFEQAANGVIADALSVPVALPGGSSILPQENVVVSFTLGPASGNMFMRAPEGPCEYSQYTGCGLSITVTVPWDREITDATKPDEIAAIIAEYRTRMNSYTAALRQAFSATQVPFREENLHYYLVSRCQPNGEEQGMNEQQDAHVTVMRWEIDFEIPPEAFPDLV